MDSESLVDYSRNRKNKKSSKNKVCDNDITSDDFSDLFLNINKKVSWKVAILLFILYLLINSDLFVQNVLGGISKNLVVNGIEPSSNGVIVQGILITLAYVILSIIKNII